MMSNMPLDIDNVEGGPILVMEGVPYPVVAVDSDRVANPHLICGEANVPDTFLDVRERNG